MDPKTMDLLLAYKAFEGTALQEPLATQLYNQTFTPQPTYSEDDLNSLGVAMDLYSFGTEVGNPDMIQRATSMISSNPVWGSGMLNDYGVDTKTPYEQALSRQGITPGRLGELERLIAEGDELGGREAAEYNYLMQNSLNELPEGVFVGKDTEGGYSPYDVSQIPGSGPLGSVFDAYPTWLKKAGIPLSARILGALTPGRTYEDYLSPLRM